MFYQMVDGRDLESTRGLPATVLHAEIRLDLSNLLLIQGEIFCDRYPVIILFKYNLFMCTHYKSFALV